MSTNPWHKDDLLRKAQKYSQIMCTFSRDSWDYAFWSTLVLELLARAALSNVSPTLLADAKDWNNIYSALGHTPKATKYTPKSIDISSVFERLKNTVPQFTPDHENFCASHMSRRNEELHSGGNPFTSLKISSWLPSFYQACNALLTSMDESLELLLGESEAAIANQMVSASSDESAKSIAKSINAYRTIWEDLTQSEKDTRSAQASAWATKHHGHRAECPSCKNTAVVMGTAYFAPIKSIKDDEITERQEFIPTRFECIACGLKISGLAQLSACGLGDTYTATFTYDAAEYYVQQDMYEGYEPDFNEP